MIEDKIKSYNSKCSIFGIKPLEIKSKGGQIEVKCSTRKSTKYIIPNFVTAIAEYGFYNCRLIQEILIPDNIKTIGYEAFGYCVSLRKIVIPHGVTKIDEFTFYECKKLTEVVIPSTVIEIDRSAFSYCSSLKSITIPSSVKVIHDSAFVGCHIAINRP